MELVVVGHFSRDLIITPQLRRECIGGGVAYAMLAPAIGARGTGIVSCVGRDFEKRYIEDLKMADLDLSGLRTNGLKSTRFINMYDDEGRRTQIIEAIAPSLRAQDYSSSHLQAEIVHFCPLTADEIDISCIEAAHTSDAIVSLDVQGYLRESKTGPVESREWHDRADVLGLVDVVKADDTEIRMACQTDSERDAVDRILSEGPRIVVVTRERHGSSIYTRNNRIDIPAVRPTQTVDSTGCGDTYIIAFMLEYNRCGDLNRAGLFGATCASFNLETVGPYGMPNREQVEMRMRPYLSHGLT